MNDTLIGIDKLCQELGLTSRTLRHWESQGLFKSSRNASSGWRVYDEHAVLAIQVTAFLRSYDMGIKEIKAVLEDMSFQSMRQELAGCMNLLSQKKSEYVYKELALNALLQQSSSYVGKPITAVLLTEIKETMNSMYHDTKKEEVFSVTNPLPNSANVRYITLPPMRFAYSIAVSESPEEEAMAPVKSWLEKENLVGTARLFGGNMPPHPSKNSPVYGYGMCASVPEHAEIPAHLKELRFEGGLFAMMESNDDIPGSWKTLMKKIADNPDYEADHRSRLCFEEHIRNDCPEDSGNAYFIHLLEPVRKK